jgi:hypothetical protein
VGRRPQGPRAALGPAPSRRRHAGGRGPVVRDGARQAAAVGRRRGRLGIGHGERGTEVGGAPFEVHPVHESVSPHVVLLRVGLGTGPSCRQAFATLRPRAGPTPPAG